MPSVGFYRQLEPYSAKELLAAANALLRQHERLQVTERTLRYYIAEKVLPPPEGPPKLARYSFLHLVGLIAIRGLQDRGVSLDRARDELAPIFAGDGNALRITLEVLDGWLSGSRMPMPEHLIESAFRPRMLSEPPAAPSPPAISPSPQVSYLRKRPSAEDDGSSVLNDVAREVRRVHDMVQDLSGHAAKAEPRPEESEMLVQHLDRMNRGIWDLQGVMRDLVGAVRELRDEVRQLNTAAEPVQKPEEDEKSPKE